MNLIVSLVLSLIPRLTSRALAIDVKVGLNIPGANTSTYSGQGGWAAYISDFYNYAQYVGISLAILMILYSAVLYVTSEGDSSKLGTAKEITIGALVGLAMLFMINYLAKVLGIVPIAPPTT